MTKLKGSKVKYLNFAIVNIFAEILHAGRAAIDMKHIERDFHLNDCMGLSPLGGFRGWGRGQSFFSEYGQEYGHVAYQIKADNASSNMVANIKPTDTPSTKGWGQKVKIYLFLKVVMLHIKLKLTTLAAAR